VLVEQLRAESITTGRRLQRLLGREHVLFLKNEDMDTQDFIAGLGSFTGLHPDRFPNLTNTYTNCNNQKGLLSECQVSPNSSSNRSYEISNNRPMLSETRALIYHLFAPECQIWEKEFGVSYHDCLNVASA
jgi:hypothetical protein